MPQPPKRKSAKSTKKAPATLAKNAAKVASRAARTNEVWARELIALIRQRTDDVAAAFYDIGVALAELSEPRLYTALGYSSFAALVKKELGFSYDKAREMVAVTRGLKRTTAVKLGLWRSAAVLELTEATPEDDTPEQVATGKVTVRGHRTPVRPKEMSARAILQAAKTERRSHRSPKTDEDAEVEAAVAKLEARLRKKDPRATATVAITRPKGGTVTRKLKLSVAWEAFLGVVKPA
jgi:hypothetical protein